LKQVLLDEGVPRQLATPLRDVGHKVSSFPSGWKGTPDRALLALAEGHGFDVLVTCDRNLVHQQNLSGNHVAVLALATTRRVPIMSRALEIARVVEELRPGEYVEIDWDGSRRSTRLEDGRTATRSLVPMTPFGSRAGGRGGP
jgi:hypothetical protein